METFTDMAILFAFISLAATISLNAYRYSQESKYLKQKYINKGYWKGYRKAEKDCKVLQEIKDNQSKKK